MCEGGDGTDCLTAGEVAAARAIYAGPTRPGTGERIFPGYALGSEHFEAPDGLGGWARYWSGVDKPGGSAIDFMRYSVFQDPDYDLRGFDFDADWDLANDRVIGTDETLGSALNAVDPDLSAFKAAGGRLISYHGWADALIPGQYAIDYYDSVIEAMGGLAETTDFYRLFMAPGVAHCRGGPGPGSLRRGDRPRALGGAGRGPPITCSRPRWSTAPCSARARSARIRRWRATRAAAASTTRPASPASIRTEVFPRPAGRRWRRRAAIDGVRVRISLLLSHVTAQVRTNGPTSVSGPCRRPAR